MGRVCSWTRESCDAHRRYTLNGGNIVVGGCRDYIRSGGIFIKQDSDAVKLANATDEIERGKLKGALSFQSQRSSTP